MQQQSFYGGFIYYIICNSCLKNDPWPLQCTVSSRITAWTLNLPKRSLLVPCVLGGRDSSQSRDVSPSPSLPDMDTAPERIFPPRGGSFSFFVGGAENKSSSERSSSKSPPRPEDFGLEEELVVTPFTSFSLAGGGGAVEMGLVEEGVRDSWSLAWVESHVGGEWRA